MREDGRARSRWRRSALAGLLLAAGWAGLAGLATAAAELAAEAPAGELPAGAPSTGAPADDASTGEPSAGEMCLERLRATLTEGDPRQRLAAVSGLAALAGVEAVESLAAAALEDEAPAVREEALYALGRRGVDAAGAGATLAALAALEQALLDPQPRVREAAVEALTDRGGEAAAWALAAALDDPEPALRRRAVEALGEIGLAESGPDESAGEVAAVL